MEHATWTVRILMLLIVGAILSRIIAAKSGKQLFVRRIPGVDALEEAIGRATEMGRPIIFVPGTGGLDVPTFAGLRILDFVTRKCAHYGTKLVAAIANPAVYPVAQDMYHEAYRSEGREEYHDSENVRFLSTDVNAFASAVAGMTARDKAAAICYFGSFGFESMLMSEPGRRMGAIQIAATDQFHQIPFFITTCDYTMIGEELYAASSYVSREATMLGSLIGQDIGKLIVSTVVIAGVIVSTIASLSIMFAPGMKQFNWLVGLLNR